MCMMILLVPSMRACIKEPHKFAKGTIIVFEVPEIALICAYISITHNQIYTTFTKNRTEIIDLQVIMKILSPFIHCKCMHLVYVKVLRAVFILAHIVCKVSLSARA